MSRGNILVCLALLAACALPASCQIDKLSPGLGEQCKFGDIVLECQGSDVYCPDFGEGNACKSYRQEGELCDWRFEPCQPGGSLYCDYEYDPKNSSYDYTRCKATVPLGKACCQEEQCNYDEGEPGPYITCENSVCVSKGDPSRTQALGQDCISLPTDTCLDGLRCADATCIPENFRLMGESCSRRDVCVEGLTCTLGYDGYECAVGLQLGDECPCDVSEDCDDLDLPQCAEGNCMDGVCVEDSVRTRLVGQGCPLDRDWARGPAPELCVVGARCFENVCYSSPGQLGDPCESDWNVDVSSAPRATVNAFCADGLQCREDVCAPAVPLLGEGAACQWSYECMEDLACDRAEFNCTRRNAQVGEACDHIEPGPLVWDPISELELPLSTCAEGLRCFQSGSVDPGFCSNNPSQEGERCAISDDDAACAGDLECAFSEASREFFCRKRPSLGDPCECEMPSESCRAHEHCLGEGVYCMGGTCDEQSIQTGEVGDDCITVDILPVYYPNSRKIATCRPGLYCEGDFGNCRVIPPPCIAGQEDTGPGLQGDPHMVGFNGLRFDYDGRPGQAFDLVSTPDISINALIMPDLVHGMTYVGALGISSSCGHTAVIRADAAEDRLTLEVDDSVVETLEGHPVTAGSLQLEAAGGGDVRVTVAGVSMVVEVHKRIFLNVKDMAFTHGVPAGVTGVLGHTARPDRAQAQGLEHAEEYYFVDSLLDKSARPTRPRRMGVVAELLAEASQVAAASMIHSVTA